MIQHNLEKFGMVTVMDVVLYDSTGKPVLFLDTLKMSNINTEGNNKEIRGGRGADLLINYDFGRTANVEMQDALLSPASLAILWGVQATASIIKDVNVVGTTVPADTPTANSVYIYATADGAVIAEAATDFSAYSSGEARFIYKTAVAGTTTTKTENFIISETGNIDTIIKLERPVTITSVTQGISYVFDIENAQIVFDSGDLDTATAGTITVTYESSSQYAQITLTADDFPDAYRLVGETFVIDQGDGKKKHIQIEIPKFKLNANFSFSMDAEGDASVFDFSGVALSDGGDLIKFKYLGDWTL